MNLNDLVTQLKKFSEMAEAVSDGVKNLQSDLTSDDNTMASLRAGIIKKRTELAIIEAEVKTRLTQFEGGIAAMRKELEVKLGDAETLKQSAVTDRHNAARELNLAKTIRQEAEAHKAEVVQVAKSQTRRGKKVSA